MIKKENLVFDIGINDYQGKISTNGKHIKSYATWKNILRRCYSEKYQEKQPTYRECTVSNEWLSFSNFKEWFDKNYRYDLEELGIRVELDKDLLVDNNKVYSFENCIFIPHRVNGFLTNKKLHNTSGVTGVSWHKRDNKWRARIKDFETGKEKFLGYFTDIGLASKAYVHARELEVIKVKQYLIDLGYSDYIVNRII